MLKVQDILNELDGGLGVDSVDRAHRIGLDKMSNVDGTLHQQVIVRFSSFKDRSKVYRSLKKVKKVKIRLDLMKNRLGTRKLASEWAKRSGDVDFVFADINCNLVAKMKNGTFTFFSSVEKLQFKVGNEKS